ncbi:hypothetical protein JCM3775_001780 [Rhodotorula graminis]
MPNSPPRTLDDVASSLAVGDRLPAWDGGFCMFRVVEAQTWPWTRGRVGMKTSFDGNYERRAFWCRRDNCAYELSVDWKLRNPLPLYAKVVSSKSAHSQCTGQIFGHGRRFYNYEEYLADAKRAALKELRRARNMFGCLGQVPGPPNVVAMRKHVVRQKQILSDVKCFFPPHASEVVVRKANKNKWLFDAGDVLCEAEAARAARQAAPPVDERERANEPPEDGRMSAEAAGAGAASGEDEPGGPSRERDGDAASPEPPKKRIKLALLDPTLSRPRSAQQGSAAHVSPAQAADAADAADVAPYTISATGDEPDKAPSPSPSAAQTSFTASADDDAAARSTTPIETESHDQPRHVDKGKGRAVSEEEMQDEDEDEGEEEVQGSSPEPGRIALSSTTGQADINLAAGPVLASAAAERSASSTPTRSQAERSRSVSVSAGAERRQESRSLVAEVDDQLEVIDLLNEDDEDDDVKPALNPVKPSPSDPSSLAHLLFSLPSPFAFVKHLALFHHPSIDLTLADELLDIASSPDDLDDLLGELVKDQVGEDGEALKGMPPTWAKALRRALRKKLEEGGAI